MQELKTFKTEIYKFSNGRDFYKSTINIHTNDIERLTLDTIQEIRQTLRNIEVYFSDTECRYWSFDTKLKRGLWIENITYTNALKNIECLVLY